MIRILIVDDSITQREILRKVLEAEGGISVVGEASDGIQAVTMVKQCAPDIVLMDVHMPKMDGIEATRQIMRQCPVSVVIVSATLQRRDIDHGLAALEAGAVSIVQKPKGAALLHLKDIGPELREAILAASQAKVKRLVNSRSHARPESEAAAAPPRTFNAYAKLSPVEIVGICTSTGGPSVLAEILSAIPKPFPLPILLVQHISEFFVEGFATWLSSKCGQPVRIAGDDQRLEPCLWIAPPGKHLTLANRRRIRLVAKVSSDVHCPSGNPLFSSLAKHFGSEAAGVQLTGMGDDGAEGLLKIKQAGGQTLIQNEATSMIYGMPKAAKQLGAAQHELSPGEIAKALAQMAQGKP